MFSYKSALFGYWVAAGLAVGVPAAAQVPNDNIENRRLLPAEAVLAGGRASGHHAEGSVPWVSAEDGAGLRERLGEVGILRDPS